MIVETKTRLHQDNLKAEIYHRFKLRHPDESPIKMIVEYYYQGCRFDAIIYDKRTKEALVIIEVRRRDMSMYVNPNSRKHLQYSKFNVPIYYIGRYSDLDELFAKLS